MIDCTEGEPTSGDSRQNDEEPLTDAEGQPDTEGEAGDEGAGGAPGPESPEEPPVATMSLAEAEALLATRRRLLARRAVLVEQRRVIMFGKARDDIAREIERIDRRLRRTDCPG